jgi:ATP-dependent helicase/nuclease subunit A
MKNIRIIGAGAGSGKTYRLSMEVFEGIKAGTYRPDAIMLTTFTKRGR